MKLFEFSAFAISIVFTCSVSSQTLTPGQSRQVQFIWDQSGTSFDGKSKPVLDSIFRIKSHQGIDLVLAINRRTEPLPPDWTVLAEASNESMMNLLTSQSFLHPGVMHILIPKSANPTDWHSANWMLVVDGIETPCTLDSAIQFTVPDHAEATSIGIRVEHQGTLYERHILLPVFGQENCPEPDDPPWPINNQSDPHWVGVFDDGTPVTGQALVRLGADQVFDRPMIILEGFDPNLQGTNPTYGFGDMNWDVLWNCEGEANAAFSGLAAMLDSVMQEGFDLVFLDYQTGTHSIFRQAKLLQHVIEKCRDARIGSEPMVVIGPSMGGVVARHTLSLMEEEDTPHCVRLFISLDSPFRGAHLPLAFQQSIAFFSNISADAADLEQALLSPAAGELLVESPFHTDEARTLLEASQNNLGLPKIPVNLSIVNSNPLVPFEPPAVWYHANEDFLGWDLVDITLWSQPGNADHAESTENDWVTLDASLINPSWQWGDPIQYQTIDWNPSGDLNLEQLAGSYSLHLSQFAEALEQAGIEASSWTDQSMFIPCHSALDISLGAPFDVQSIPFDFWQTENPASGSTFHCSIENHFSLIWEAIVNGQPQNPESSTLLDTIRIGWEQPFNQFLNTLDVDSLVQLEIGTSAANGVGTWPQFEASNSPCNPNLVIPSSAAMLIGDSSGNGNAAFTLTANSTLEICGDLHIGAHSKLIIEKGARVILNDGQIHVHSFGTIDQHQDGQIEIEGSAIIALNGSTSKWEMAGDLILNGQDSLLISSEIQGGTGVWEWNAPTSYTYIGTHGQVAFEGNMYGFGDIIIYPDAGHLFDGSGEVSLSQSNLHFQNNAHMSVNARMNLDHVYILGTGQGNQITASNRIHWNKGTLHNCNVLANEGSIASAQCHQVHSYDSELDFDSTGVRLNECTFTDSYVRMHAVAPNSSIKHCEFIGGKSALPQIEIHSYGESFRLEDNEFKDHPLGIYSEGTELKASCNVWSGLDIALDLANASLLNASSPNGQNQWYSNGIHVRCNQAMAPNFMDGWNQMEDAEDALFLGSLSISTELGNTNMPHIIAQNQNFWPASLEGVPIVVPYTGLHAFNTENPVFFKDASPYFESCQVVPPLPADSDLKKGRFGEATSDSLSFWLAFPNPVTRGNLTIAWMNELPYNYIELKFFTSNGQCVQTTRLPTNATSECSVDISHLSRGFYHLEIRGPEQTLLNQSKIVVLQ